MNSLKDPRLNEKLDRTGREITRASVLPDEEAGDVASAPFLFKRVRALVEQEQKQRGAGSIWTGFRSATRKAIPGMVVVAALSSGLSLYSAGNKSGNPAFSVDAYLGTNEAGIENMFFAERRPLTTEEVLATIINRDEREAGK